MSHGRGMKRQDRRVRHAESERPNYNHVCARRSLYPRFLETLPRFPKPVQAASQFDNFCNQPAANLNKRSCQPRPQGAGEGCSAAGLGKEHTNHRVSVWWQRKFFSFNNERGGTRCPDIYTNKIVITEGHVSDFSDAHEHLQT